MIRLPITISVTLTIIAIKIPNQPTDTCHSKSSATGAPKIPQKMRQYFSFNGITPVILLPMSAQVTPTNLATFIYLAGCLLLPT